MLLHCGAGEDFWELPWTARRSSLSILKEINPEYSLEGWCWSWSTNPLATWCEELTHWKRPWCWERLKRGREGDNGRWDGWMASPTRWTWVWATPGVGDGQEAWCAAVHGVTKHWTWLSNWTDQKPWPKNILISRATGSRHCCHPLLRWNWGSKMLSDVPQGHTLITSRIWICSLLLWLLLPLVYHTLEERKAGRADKSQCPGKGGGGGNAPRLLCQQNQDSKAPAWGLPLNSPSPTIRFLSQTHCGPRLGWLSDYWIRYASMGLEKIYNTFLSSWKRILLSCPEHKKEPGIRLIRNANGCTFSFALEGTGFLKEADALADAGQQVCPLCTEPQEVEWGVRQRQIVARASWWLKAMSVSQPQNIWDHELQVSQMSRNKRRRFVPWAGKNLWRRAWQPTPVFLPGESHGQRSLVGYSS